MNENLKYNLNNIINKVDKLKTFSKEIVMVDDYTKNYIILANHGIYVKPRLSFIDNSYTLSDSSCKIILTLLLYINDCDIEANRTIYDIDKLLILLIRYYKKEIKKDAFSDYCIVFDTKREYKGKDITFSHLSDTQKAIFLNNDFYSYICDKYSEKMLKNI